MGYFPRAIAAYLKKRTVRCAPLALFWFDTGPIGLWNGFNTFDAGGITWNACKGLATIEGIEEPLSGEAKQVKVSIAGDDVPGASLSVAAKMAATVDKAVYKRRLLQIYLQFFDTNWQPGVPDDIRAINDSQEPWTQLDEPFAILGAFMDEPEFSREPIEGGGCRRTIAMTAENIFAGRNVSPFGFYTDRDQQRRFVGDKGLEFVKDLQNKTVPTPW